MIPKIPFKKMFVTPHPYLSYVNKKYFTYDNERPSIYPLNRDKGYYFTSLTSNNMGLFNGPKGDRDIIVPKPEKLIRINCLGASTTGNYIVYNGHNFSYPLELEKVLCRRFSERRIEVNNCGIGGWTSAEILISFLLSGMDTSPDIVVLYHAYNDIEPSLTPEFQSDYSHAKRNLGERYHLYYLLSLFPSLPLSFYNWAINRSIGQNIGHSLLSSISKGKVNYRIDFQGLDTYKRNIEYIINICLSHKIKIILSTFCFNLYDAIKNNEMHKKLRQGVLRENKIIKGLSAKYSIPLVDNFHLIPEDNKYFVDSVHFTPEGMSLLAENMSVPIIKYLEEG